MAVGYRAYQKNKVATSNQKQLIVMLYDGMVKFMNQGIKAIEEGDAETAHVNLQKTGKILLELLSTLREDKGGVVAQNLKRLYVFCYEKIVIANLEKDVDKIREVLSVVNELKAGWQEVYKASHQKAENPVAMAAGGLSIQG